MSTEGETLQVSVLHYRFTICPPLVTWTETWSVSPSVDMLPFGVTVLVTVPQRSEIPEGLTNYPVLTDTTYIMHMECWVVSCMVSKLAEESAVCVRIQRYFLFGI